MTPTVTAHAPRRDAGMDDPDAVQGVKGTGDVRGDGLGLDDLAHPLRIWAAAHNTCVRRGRLWTAPPRPSMWRLTVTSDRRSPLWPLTLGWVRSVAQLDRDWVTSD